MEKLRNIYLNMRKQNSYPIEWFHSYFLQKGGREQSLQKFQIAFQTVNLQILIEDLDSEFNVQIITDKNNNIVSCR